VTHLEANRLASHVEMPEIAPTCENGHTKTQKRSKTGSYYWYCVKCQSERTKGKRPERKGMRCPTCSKVMTLTQSTLRNPHGKWRCYPCGAKRRAAGESSNPKKPKLTFTQQIKREYRNWECRWNLPVRGAGDWRIRDMAKVEVTI
jgi:hypothetical protein